MIEALRGRESRHPDAELQELLFALRERLPIISALRIEMLEAGPRGGESGVYFDGANGRVYKLVPVNDGDAGYGFVPGEITRGADGRLKLGARQNVPALEFLARHDRNNQQGRMVYSEFAGITLDGDLVMRQPLVRGLRASNPAERPRWAARLGLRWLHAAPRDAAAVTQVRGRLLLVDDLHELNLMVGEGERPFIVDANSRFLTDEEAALVQAALAAHEHGSATAEA